MKYLCIVIPFLAILWSCGDSSSIPDEYKPPARGDADELILVIDSAVWEGSVGVEIRKTLEAPMLGMPQDERLFEVYKVNPLKLNSVLKSANNMIFVTTLDSKTTQSKQLRSFFTDESLKRIQRDTSYFQATENNKFAIGQKVLYLFSNTEAELAAKIAKNSDAILKLFEDQAMKITKKRLLKSRSKKIENVININHRYSIQIPYGWDLAQDQLDFIWCRELGLGMEKNIFIYQQPYTGVEVFDDMGNLRDKITELHLRDGQKSNLYIQRQNNIPVFSNQISFNGKFAMKSRGLWAVSDMSAGGPFLSYAMVDEKSQTLYYIEGYVYNAGGKKKRFMREMDAILSTFKIPSELKGTSIN
ncbi:MAG: DUF4837 family protein [Cytophagales bacterium]|nr:DUF4837 family protein [Cytophagales bacterium]